MNERSRDQGLNQPTSPGYAFAKKFGAVLTDLDTRCARIACRSNVTPLTLTELRRHFGRPLELTQYPADEFETLTRTLFAHGESSSVAAVADNIDLQQAAEALPEPSDLLESDDDAPIIRLINALFTEAIKENASDIHIEPFESRLVIRFRVDGVLREVLAPERSLASLVVSRIKVMADLDIAEKRLPQDGRISLRIAGRPVDVRVSTLPSGHGERVVLRLLDKQAGRLDLARLGMSESDRARFESMIRKPHGIILVTGPTGSGKTTTLYAALSRLNDRSRNIITVEDPIEYYIDGIGQTQVNSKVDMSFARGLRAILRQDPDVVMVGEIRDLETAQIAVQASLTGHLVLSTVHTNTASGTLVRLQDMGVEPFLLSSSLVAVLAQRLVRLLCETCREPYSASRQELEALGSTGPQRLYRAKGCDQCRQTGYRGRTGFYELLVVDSEIQQLIHDGAGQLEIERFARTRSDSILDDGRSKVLAGETTMEEMLRVVQDGGV